jgi:Domain of unknown function (DUF4124)
MQPLQLASIAFLAALAGVAFAQTYRYVYPDGRVIYSDKPVPGARLQGEVAPPPPPGAAPAASREDAPKPPGEDPAAARMRLRAEADDEVRQAEQALAQARARLESGKEPLPGERTGTASGRSRLNEAYDARQRENEEAVADAQARLERAAAARNATR